MAYFHRDLVQSIGGKKGRPVIKVVGESWEEMRSLHREYPDETVLIYPKRGSGNFKRRPFPELWLDADKKAILDEIESAEVGQWTIRALTMMIRHEFWLKYGDGESEIEHWFQKEIRGKIIEMRKWNEWSNGSENQGLNNLMAKLEKIDLGRRNDLNPHHPEYRTNKYGSHSQTDDDQVVDWGAKYRNSSPEERIRLLEEHPWLKRIVDL
jgi:hypothetical protein